MINRETKLLAAKQKLQRFQRTRNPNTSNTTGSLYNVEGAISPGSEAMSLSNEAISNINAGLVSSTESSFYDQNSDFDAISPGNRKLSTTHRSSKGSPTRKGSSPKLTSKSLNNDTATFNLIIEELSAAKSSLESQLAQSNTTNASLLEKLETLENERALEKEKNDVSMATSPSRGTSRGTSPFRNDSEKQQLVEKLDDAEKQLLSAKSRISELEDSLALANSKVSSEHENYSTATNELLERVSAKDEELEAVKGQLQLIQGDLEIFKSERSQFLDEVKTKSGVIGTLEAEVEQLRKGLEAGTTVLKRLEASEKEKSELFDKVVALEASIAETTPSTSPNDELSALESKIIALESELAESKTQNEDLQQQLQAFKWENEWPSLPTTPPTKSKQSFPDAATNTSSINATAELESQVSQLQTEVQVLTAEAESERLRSHDLQLQITALKQRLQDSTAAHLEASRLESEIAHIHRLKEEESRDFENRAEALEYEINELKKYLKASEEDNGELREQVELLEETISKSRSASAVVSPVTVKACVVASPQAGEVQRLKKELEALNGMFEEESGRLEREVAELKKYLKASEEDNGDLREQVELLEEQLETLQQQQPPLERSVPVPRPISPEKPKSVKEEAWDSWDADEIDSTIAGTQQQLIPPEKPKPVTEEAWDSWRNDEVVPAFAATSADTKIQELELQIDILSQDKITALEKLTLALEERGAIAARLGELEAQLTLTDEQRDHLSTEIRTLSIERDTLLQKVSHIQENVKDLQSQVNTITKARDEALVAAAAGTGNATKILEEVQQKLSVAISERDQAVSESVRVQEEVARLKEEAVFAKSHTVDLDTMLSLQKDHDELKEALDAKSEEYEGALEKLESVMQENESLLEQVETLRESGGDAAEALRRLQKTHDTLLIEHEQVLGEQEGLDETNKELGAQNQSLVAAAEEAHSRHLDLSQRYDDVLVQLNALEDQNQRIRETGSEVIGIKASLEQENADLNQQLETLREAGAKILQDRQALEEEADALAGQVDELNQQLALFTEEKYAMENEIGQLRGDLENRNHMLQETESRAARFEKLFREIEQKASNDANELVDTLRNLTDENSDMKHKVQEQVDACNALKYDIQDLETLNKELLSKQDSYEKERAEKLAELEYKSSQLIELESQLHTIHTTTSESIQLIDIERGQLAEQVQDIQSKNSALALEIQQLEKERDQLLQQLNDLSQQYSALQETASTRSVDTSEVDELRALLAESEARFDQLFTDGEAHTLHLEQQIDEAAARIESFNTERDQLIYEIDFLKERLAAEEEFSASENKAKQAITTEIGQLRATHQKALGRVEQLEGDLMASEDVLSRVTAKLGATEEQLVNLADEAERLRGERDGLAIECNSLKSQIDGLTNECNQLKSRVDEAVNESAYLTSQLDEYEAEKQNLGRAAEELSTLRGVVDGLERDRADLLEQYKHLQHAMDESHVHVGSLEQQLENGLNGYEELQQQFDAAVKDSEYYQQQVAQLQEAVAAMELERDVALDERNDAQSALNSINAGSSTHEAEKEEIRAHYEEEVSVLKDQIHALEQQHEADIQIRLEQFENKYAQYEAEKMQEVFDLQEKLNRITLEAQEVEHQLTSVTQQLVDVESLVPQLQQRCDDAENRAATAETAYSDLNIMAAQLTAERNEVQQKFLDGADALESLKSRLEASENQTMSLLSEKDATIHHLQASLDDSYRNYNEKEALFENEKQTLVYRCEEAEGQWRSLQLELEKVLSQYSESQRIVETNSYQLQEAAIKLEASEQERLLVSSERDSLDRQLVDLREVESTQHAELDQLHVRITQSDERIKTLEQLVDSLESQRAQFNSVINNETSLVQDIAHKQQVIENLERELLQLKSMNASPNPVFAGILTADSLFNGSSNGTRGVTLEHELALLKLEVRNKEDELAAVHQSYKQVVGDLEEKLNNYIKLNKSSVQSMELYRDELLKKSDRLEIVEEELFKLKAHVPNSQDTPDTSMLDISKYEEAIDRASKTSKTLDDLLSITNRGSKAVSSLGSTDKAEILDILTSQIGALLKSTETNVTISRRILNEVSGPIARSSLPSSAVRSTPNEGQIKLIVQSQSSILDDHKRLLNDVELLARLFKEAGSPRKGEFFGSQANSSTEAVALISKFVEKVDQYQKSVSGFALTKQAVLEDIKSIHTPNVQTKTVMSSLNILISGLEDVKTQNKMLRREISYLGALVSKIHSSQSATTLHKHDGNGQDYNLSSREYSDLVTKASQSERYQQQAENNQTLLAEQVREIQILKEAMESLTTKLSRESANASVSDVQTFRVMTLQIDELKKVWSHELSANMILRNLIAKTQAESMVAEQEGRKRETSLREEFDELALLFEERQGEADNLRAELEGTDERIHEAVLRVEEQMNSKFFETEQQHIEQNQQLEDMYDKERVALNKLIGNLEKERNRLLAELTSLKDHSKEVEKTCDGLRQENSMLKSRSYESRDLGRREQELVADVQALERQLHEERKAHERRMMDREAEWQRIHDEEARRRGTDFEHDRMDDVLRVFRSQKEHLEHDLMLRDNQIRTLEGRIQELLQEAESPRRGGGSRREMELERDLQASFNQIRDLKNQVGNLDHARKEAETHFALEKDRCKRLSAKADDLKRRYQYQQRLLEDQEESINSALRPAPRGGTAEDQLHDEIAHLRRELHSAKQSRNEIINVIRETLVSTVGEASIDAAVVSATSATSMVRTSHRIDMGRLRSQMSSLIAEVIYLRALANRLFLWRADLKYQKVYLSLKVADLSESQKATVKFIREMGVDAPANDLDAPVLRPIQKFRAGVNVVIGVYRMMVMARSWQDTLEDNNRAYLPVALPSSSFHDVDDEGMLADVSVRSTPQTPYADNSQMLNRSLSTSIRDVPQHTNEGYSRASIGGRQSQPPQQHRYPTVSLF
ncbi:UNVERIFIED_CONTAM: hypothetical protein HDU68_004167 [Siphonaria sp. JEL0065]|nr:hypothetical protein HDU68_004167 [Siphonaria sp. JEL0065]